MRKIIIAFIILAIPITPALAQDWKPKTIGDQMKSRLASAFESASSTLPFPVKIETKRFIGASTPIEFFGSHPNVRVGKNQMRFDSVDSQNGLAIRHHDPVSVQLNWRF